MIPKPGKRDRDGNRRPREKSATAQARCGDWTAQVSGGIAWCTACGKNLGPAR